MKKASLLGFLVLLFFVNLSLFAQESGNRIYGNQGYYNGQKHTPFTNTGSLINGTDRKYYSTEASVLINLKPDAFVVVFGIQQEGALPSDSNGKLEARLAQFNGSLSALGIKPDDIFIDFITQNKVYDYKTQGNDVIETPAGFETKKTIAIRYKDRSMFEKIVAEAAKQQIFDLIKVDYIVSDFDSVRTRLFDEAVKVIKSKEAKYASLLGVKLSPVGLANEKYDAFYPSEEYQKYQAFETGSAYNSNNRGVTVSARKASTFYYSPMSGENFDKMLNPLGIEPLVQFTLYLRMDYDSGVVVPKDK
jgi:uncharacterized protein YggE